MLHFVRIYLVLAHTAVIIDMVHISPRACLVLHFTRFLFIRLVFLPFFSFFPMHRSRPAGRRGLSSIFLVSLEKNASSFFKLRPVVNHHHRANGSAVLSPKLKQKAWPLQTPMPMLGGENREKSCEYINKCTWSCIRLTTDFIQALRCMNIYSRSVFFLSADTQIAPVIQHTLNAALYINQKKVAWVE